MQTQGRVTFKNFELECGRVLPEVTVAYVTLGRLAEHGKNAILVTHTYTSGPGVIIPGGASAESSWSALIGPGRAIDTGKFFVVCPNILGSSYGSTNAASINPETGKPYGSAFPDLTLKDSVRAQRLLMDALNVRRLVAVAGPSLGGAVVFQWAVTYPDFMDAIIPVVTSIGPPRGDITSLQANFQADANWNGGDYYEIGGMTESLTKMRLGMLKAYGFDEMLADDFPDAAARSQELQRLARRWAEGFDANSILIIMKAALAYDVTNELDRIRARVLYVLSRTDQLFPPALATEAMAAFEKAGVQAEYFEIDSNAGHFASSLDWTKWAPRLQSFLTEVTDATH